MKLREVAYLLGLRPRPKTYGHRIVTFDLPNDGAVEFAQWEHPRAKPTLIRQEDVDELRRYLRPGDTAIDIGAHVGDTTLPMALACGPRGCVLALEPNPYVLRVLEENARLNRERTNIVPLPFAATETDGRVTFEYSDAGFCNGGRHEGLGRWKHAHAFELEVDGRNLASWLERERPELLDSIRLIKVDAEGYDATVLESLSDLIAARRPYLIAEVFRHSSEATRGRLFDAIAKHGYDVHKVVGPDLLCGERLERGDMTRWEHFDVFGTPR